jgi:hypothetical protein
MKISLHRESSNENKKLFSNHFGPLLKTFYFVVNPMVRTKLEKRFSSKNYKPDWLK